MMPNKYQRSSDLEISVISDGYVVYDPARDRAHHLNLSSAVVLELCNGRETPEGIAAVLMEEFELPAPPLDDVNNCLKQFLDDGLVTAVE
jgi:hypothetical protein